MMAAPIIMTQKYVRLVTTETVPGEKRPITTGYIIWSGKRKSVEEAVASLRETALKNGMDDVVGIRIEPILDIVNVGGTGVYAAPGSLVYYQAYGTCVCYDSIDQ